MTTLTPVQKVRRKSLRRVTRMYAKAAGPAHFKCGMCGRPSGPTRLCRGHADLASDSCVCDGRGICLDCIFSAAGL